MPGNRTPLLPPHGGYRKLKSFQSAQLVYDATILFCHRWVPRTSRTRDLRRQLVEISRKADRSDPLGIGRVSSEVASNTLICLIHQTRYLLRRQLMRLEVDFQRNGGFTERLYRSRRGA